MDHSLENQDKPSVIIHILDQMLHIAQEKSLGMDISVQETKLLF